MQRLTCSFTNRTKDSCEDIFPIGKTDPVDEIEFSDFVVVYKCNHDIGVSV